MPKLNPDTITTIAGTIKGVAILAVVVGFLSDADADKIAIAGSLILPTVVPLVFAGAEVVHGYYTNKRKRL